MENVLLKTDMPDITFLRRGKVRDIYAVDDYLLLIATDRISAFDVFSRTVSLVRQDSDSDIALLVSPDGGHHEEPYRGDRSQRVSAICHKYADQLEGRSMLVKKQSHAVECIVRDICRVRLEGVPEERDSMRHETS